MHHQLKSLISVLSLFCGLASSASSQAALYDRGGGLIYDDVLNVTWSKDANLFLTLANQSVNKESFVLSVINAVNGAVQISRQYPYTSEYRNFPNETEIDFNITTGQLSWFGANAFVGYLNKNSYGGFDDWRLPAEQLTSGYSPNPGTNQELSHMFYSNLGGIPNQSITSNHNNIGNYDLFRNIEPYAYWSGNVDDLHLWAEGVHFQNGMASAFGMDSFFYSWVVRDGDVGTVPIPASAWLFGSAILGLITFRKKST